MWEAWRAVAGFEGLYEASSFGQVRRVERRAGERGAKRHLWEKIISPKVGVGRHLYVKLQRDGEEVVMRVADVVMLAFKGVPAPGMIATHKTEDITNNRLDNLAYWPRKGLGQ
jgi:hypothetical protein